MAASLMLTALLTVALSALIGMRLIRQAEERVALAELRRQADAVSGEAVLLGSQPRQTLRFLRIALDLTQASVYRIGPGGVPGLIDGESTVTLTAGDAGALAAGSTVEGRRPAPEGEMLFVARPLGRPAGRNRILVIARPLDSSVGELPVGTSILIATTLAAGAAALVAIFVSNRVAEPLGELAGAARDVARGNFSRRVPVRSDDEIGVVAESFNSMAAELGNADRRQRDFFLSISHELRTPLTAIQGYGEAIEDGTASNESLKQAAGVIVGESKRLTRLVNDLLDLARIDARRFEVRSETVDLTALLERICRNFAPKAQEGGVEIVLDAGPGWVRADPDRLVQVLSNLVENALRYTPSGGKVKLSTPAAGEWVRVQIEDTGPGFATQDFARAFDRQYLWNRYRGVRDVGTGLGLAITKELAEAMGGRVFASAGDGGGAVFTVELPEA
ncbi:MAG: ATP-binding protein [Actinomycetota bacterium]